VNAVDGWPGGVVSVRMRASLAGCHVSGAERLAPAEMADAVARELDARARSRRPAPDNVVVHCEPVDPAAIACAPVLPVTTIEADRPLSARPAASELLVRSGVSPEAVDRAFCGLVAGWHANGPIRGAAIVDRASGRRLDTRADRGVRVSRFDYAPDAAEPARAALADAGLGHFRTAEALALATKTLWAGVSAELCWSDDADYVAGYVATPESGYCRFDRFKPDGAVGGRAFFVDPGVDVDVLIERLERAPLWIVGIPAVRRQAAP